MKILKFIPLAAAFVGLLTACDNCDNRYETVEIKPGADTTALQRTALLLDFTGQNCVNCPDGHAMMTTLKNQWGERFIPVSIHAGGDTWSKPERDTEDGMRNADGEAIAQHFGVKATTPFPSAVVGYRGSFNSDVRSWSSMIMTEMQMPAPVVDLAVNASLSDDKKSVSIDVTMDPTADYTGDLHVWVLESNIIASQHKGNDNILDYCHNHVFRGTVNGVNGDQITLTKGNVETKHFTVAVKDLPEDDDYYALKWNPDNLTIVAFLATDKDGADQAAEFSFIKE